MSQSNESSFRSRILLLVPVAVLGVLSIIATGGGGGGGNGNGGGNGEVPPIILSSYNFEIGSWLAQGGLSVEASAFLVAVDFGNTLTGSVNLDVGSNNQVTFLSYVVDEGSSFNVTVSNSQTPLDGTFAVNMTAALNVDVNAEPTSGTFDVVAGNEIATVNIVANGVELSLNGGAATFYSWGDYDNILNNPLAEAWQQRAALAGSAMGFIFDLVFKVSDQLDQLDASVVAPITTSCDMFDGTPPDGVSAQGENVLTWQGPGDELIPGAVFDWEFTDCWDANDFQLANGLIQFANYTEQIDASNRLTRIGFVPDAGVNGGISFLGWTLSQTDLDQGVYTIDPANDLRLSGGFSLLFEAM
jgi:hypothetical protein